MFISEIELGLRNIILKCVPNENDIKEVIENSKIDFNNKNILLNEPKLNFRKILSSLTLSQYKNIIITGQNWKFFKNYFPLRKITIADLDKIIEIRNAIFHFRKLELEDDEKSDLKLIRTKLFQISEMLK